MRTQRRVRHDMGFEWPPEGNLVSVCKAHWLFAGKTKIELAHVE